MKMIVTYTHRDPNTSGLMTEEFEADKIRESRSSMFMSLVTEEGAIVAKLKTSDVLSIRYR